MVEVIGFISEPLISFVFLGKFFDVFVTKTVGCVIVHHTDRLHERITNGWTHKIESPPF